MAHNSCVSTEGEWVSKTQRGKTYLRIGCGRVTAAAG